MHFFSSGTVFSKPINNLVRSFVRRWTPPIGIRIRSCFRDGARGINQVVA
jgi:hypothetical protein